MPPLPPTTEPPPEPADPAAPPNIDSPPTPAAPPAPYPEPGLEEQWIEDKAARIGSVRLALGQSPLRVEGRKSGDMTLRAPSSRRVAAKVQLSESRRRIVVSSWLRTSFITLSHSRALMFASRIKSRRVRATKAPRAAVSHRAAVAR